jgi:hypothetical protein
MDCVENTVSSIVAHGLVAVGTSSFRGRYLVTGLRATILYLHLECRNFSTVSSIFPYCGFCDEKAGVA